MEQKPSAAPWHDDADLAGESLLGQPAVPESVADALSPEIAAEIRQLEARQAQILSRREFDDTTDEPVAVIDGAETQRIAERLAHLRAQQQKHVDAMSEDETAGDAVAGG